MIEDLKDRLKSYEMKKLELQGKVSVLETQIDNLVVHARELRSKLESYKRLYSEGYISRSDLEDIESRYRNVQSRLSKLLASLKANLNAMRKIDDGISETKAQIDNLVKLSRDLRNYIERIEIKSPVDGRVVSIYKKEGDMVRLKEPLMVLENPREKGYVIGRFKKSEAEFVKPGDRAYVFFPALNVSVNGKVSSIGKTGLYDESIISESEEFALKDVPIKVSLERKPPGASLGMRAEVVIEAENYKPSVVRIIDTFIR